MFSASNRRFDQRLVWLLITIAAAFVAYYYYQGWYTAASSLFSLGDEGTALFAARELWAGQNPYESARLLESPWRVVTYPPAYYYLGSWFFKLTGAHLYPLRAISMAAFVVAQVCAYRIFSLSGCSRLARVLGLITLASFWTIWSFSFKARVDISALALMLLSIEQYLVLARKPKDDNIFRFPRLIVIATLASLAVLTKQGEMVVVPAIAAALIVGRQWRLSLFFMSMTTFLISSSAWIVNGATAGGFMRHLRFAAASQFNFAYLNTHIGWLGPDGIILFLALFAAPIFLVGYFKRREERDGPYRQHLAALVLAFVLLIVSSGGALYAMGKHSGSVGEAIVPMFAAAWLTALASDYMRRRLLLALFIAFAASFYVINDLTRSMVEGEAKMEAFSEKIAAVRFDRKLILAEDAAIVLELDAVPEFVDLPTFYSVWLSTRKSDWDIVKMRVASQRYGAVIINSRDGCLLPPPQFWDESFILLLKEKYRPILDVKDDGRNQDFYLPRPDNNRRR